MTALDFLARLKKLDIQLSIKGDRLHLNAPSGALTGDLKVEIRERKAEILKILREIKTSGKEQDNPIRSIPEINHYTFHRHKKGFGF